MNQMHFDDVSRYVTFRLSNTLMGISILDIREIVSNIRITQVQQAPDFVSGLMNLRGQILTILDLGVLLGEKRCKIHSGSHVFVFKYRNAGFIVDQIGDVMGVKPETIEATPANVEPEIQRYISHVINLPDEILMVLDAKKVLSYAETWSAKSGGNR